MLCKVGIDCYAIVCDTKMYPVRLYINLSLPFLQKQDIRCHFCSCIILKCSIRKSDRSHKLCSLSQILSDSRIAFIQCSLCGNHCNHTARSYLIECLCKKIIVNTEVVLIVLWIKYLIISKRHISYNNIKEVIRICGVFKARNADVGILVKLFCNPSRYAVQFHPIQFTLLHWCWHTSEEIADTHRRLQDISTFKPKLHKG